jgi:hypothetical protein
VSCMNTTMTPISMPGIATELVNKPTRIYPIGSVPRQALSAALSARTPSSPSPAARAPSPRHASSLSTTKPRYKTKNENKCK